MKKLYYVHDPMCSWCWGFNRTWSEVISTLADTVEIEYVVGGLAPDSDVPMREDMQVMLQKAWEDIEHHIPGTQFNFEFWTSCSPRRSTYPACRAVIAANNQNAEKAMILAIQQAYYLNARNPSDDATLVSLANDLSLDVNVFKRDLNSSKTQAELEKQIDFAHLIGAQGFPSLIMQMGEQMSRINIDYNSADNILRQLEL